MTPLEIKHLFSQLQYQRDIRKPPDERRRGQFRAGWGRRVRGKTYDQETLQRLTWNNLGYRLGGHFGRQSTEQIDEAYQVLANLYEQSDGSSREGAVANFRGLSDPKAVLKAIAQYDKIGQEAFLKLYGYGKARNFLLLHKGRRYDSKAIVGAAYQHQFGSPLTSKDFSGGLATVVPKLESLGFVVVALDVTDSSVALAEEVPESMWEGGKRSVTVNTYERSADARAACIEAHGSSCVTCDIDFGSMYGDQFHGFIHVHHKVPVSKIGSRYKVNPKDDLVPVCPNCHAVIHYGGKTRSIEEVRSMLASRKQRG